MTRQPEPDLSRFIWETRYRDSDRRPAESGIEDTWRRVAAATAAVERDSAAWSARFLGILQGYRFLPAGRILAAAGTARRATLFSCFVMGPIEDSIEGIFEALKEGALTMQQGGGVGYDFSTLRPRGSRARSSGLIASGPVSFLRIWDAMCATMLSTGARRGAMMATLRCDHPDIGEFVDAKRAPGALAHFNLSVLVSDAFMRAVKDGHDWPLVFPADGDVHAKVPARELWHRLCSAACDTAEPGVLFIDRINAANNLSYCERLSATNPCAEEPLPPYGACNLGSVNLTQFVSRPFTPEAGWDLGGLADTAAHAVRFLDDVAEISRFPLERQRDEYRRSRRIGLGITGLADALAMLTLRYDGDAARAAAARAMETIRDAAYESSAALARERGSFAAFQADAYLERPFIRALPAGIRAAIRRGGIRNSHLTAIAPAGTISLLARNVSSGIEPCPGLETVRRVIGPDGTQRSFHATSYAYDRWRSADGDSRRLPPYFMDAAQVPATDHLLMQAALQPYVDSGISKTVTLAHDFPPNDVAGLLQAAYDLGLKGCTLYREGTRPGVIECRRPAVSAEGGEGTVPAAAT
jgi:ribonucleoside-diphosphate reductase alpha chain